ncbi:hypothetical protein M433DRAFT_151171 [Acidomyces richmondensis BFW]|nr:MAG: hypothetical protein FE78DRAFT_84886 [Acidomyces sp. 'richmondensis']KYG48337.1 hypothetical protein M433DRAFT_151171 [Acidomyces richmondensis BFW]
MASTTLAARAWPYRSGIGDLTLVTSELPSLIDPVRHESGFPMWFMCGRGAYCDVLVRMTKILWARHFI